MTSRDAIHKRSTNRAEEIRHGVPTGYGFGLSELGQLLVASNMSSLVFSYDEVGGEHGGCDFVAVAAVADEAVYESFGICRLCCLLEVSHGMCFGDDRIKSVRFTNSI